MLSLNDPLVGPKVSLFGASDPMKFTDPNRIGETSELSKSSDTDTFRPNRRDIHGSSDHKEAMKYTIIIIIISAIIFVTTVAIYNLIQNIITVYYSNITAGDPRSMNTDDDIIKILLANHFSTEASIAFAVFCIISAIVVIPFLIWYIGR